MADFFTSLFESIFTPGPTPTLVVATNASFAALQILLLSLVVATFNIHFIVLSVLTAGLWWAVNWFVRELEIARGPSPEGTGNSSPNAASVKRGNKERNQHKGTEDSGTETEDVAGRGTGLVEESQKKDNMRLRVQNHSRGRRSSASDVSGTDSEWDKVEVEEDDDEPSKNKA